MDAARQQAIRDRIKALEAEIAGLRAQLAAQPKVYQRVLALLKNGCNTSRDIADELPTTVRLASSHLRMLKQRGLARRTGRVIRVDDSIAPLVVWEAV